MRQQSKAARPGLLGFLGAGAQIGSTSLAQNTDRNRTQKCLTYLFTIVR
jgi:hypothetical protein